MPFAFAIPQASAIPLYAGRICLVNSSSVRGWVIPKGRIEPLKTPHRTAWHEAWDNDGFNGSVDEEQFWHFQNGNKGVTNRVTVCIIHVTQVADAWPEDHRRIRRWVRAQEVGHLVYLAGMRRAIARAAERCATLLNS